MLSPKILLNTFKILLSYVCFSISIWKVGGSLGIVKPEKEVQSQSMNQGINTNLLYLGQSTLLSGWKLQRTGKGSG